MRLLILIGVFIFHLFGVEISVILDWKYQFEFAGYIAAKEKGFYKDAGLDVRLIEYHNNNIVRDVLNGRYDFGIYDNNLIVDKLENKPVKLVASIFKRSALVLVTRPEIKTPKQLEHKTLMIANKDLETFKDFLKQQNVDISTIKFVPTDYSIKPFITHKVDAFSAFITDEISLLEKQNVKFNIINPSDYNFLMYQGELFTRQSLTDKNPVMVDRFKKATIKGWYYALNHKEEIAKIIYEKYTQRKSIKDLLDEAQKLERIIQRYIYPIGFIDKSLLKAQFRYEALKFHKDVDLDKIVNDYVFEFQNPLNLDEKYIVLIKLYNFYLQHKFSLFLSVVFIFVSAFFIYFYIKLKRQKEKIETLFDKAPVAYILIDFHTRMIKKANKYAYELFEYPKNKSLNITARHFHLNNQKYEEFKKMGEDYIKKHSTIEGFRVNWQLKTYTGKIIWVDVRAVMFSKTEVLWIVTDINDIMKTQKQLELQIIQTKKAMKVKEEFLANMSHEIRTPLNAILGFVDIVYEKEKDEENKKYLEIIKKSGKHLLTIINDILDFSKIESGKLKIEKIEFNPKEEFETLIALFESKAKEKNINLRISFSGLNYFIISDPTRIKQVISNLISNAIKFTPSGKNIFCNINYNSKTEKLYVEVIDEGIGISKEKLKTIFEPFSQADSSTTRKYGGTGLGLTISKNLVKLLGGELKVQSEEGKGSKFYFSIPAKKTKPIKEYKKEEIKTDNITNFNGKVLIVEDNKANQLFFKVLLNSIGIQNIDIANDGLEAIEKVANNQYDIIFMDENMPNMNGLEAAKIIKEKGIKTPIIAVTANALSGDRDKFLKVMDDYMSKPIEKEKLILILKKYLKEKNG